MKLRTKNTIKRSVFSYHAQTLNYTSFSKMTNDVTKSQQKYLRKLIGISFGIAMTDEVIDGLKLINSTLRHMKYYDIDKERLNDLQYLFNYKKNKGKPFLIKFW